MITPSSPPLLQYSTVVYTQMSQTATIHSSQCCHANYSNYGLQSIAHSDPTQHTYAHTYTHIHIHIVQSFYHKKRVNLGLIAREGFSNVSYIKKCALQHTKSLKESD